MNIDPNYAPPRAKNLANVEGQSILLISPSPIDGYPPVQNQAILLAEAGYHVVLVTSELHNRAECKFCFPGVEIVAIRVAGLNLPRRALARLLFFKSIAKARLKLGRSLVAEIAYEPEGVCMSDVVPFRNRKAIRIAHLHETLMDLENRRVERNASKILPLFDRIVVPDCNRGEVLQAQLSLQEPPTIVQNLPLLNEEKPRVARSGNGPFKVAYIGVPGVNQSIDSVVESMVQWPEQSEFHILGRSDTEFVKQLMLRIDELGLSERVLFHGWLDLSEILPFLEECQLGLGIYRPTHEVFRYSAGASNKRYQYMQAGLAQITDCNPGLPELIQGNNIGMCVSPDDVDQIAAAVTHYCKNRDECDAAGMRAYRLYRTRLHYQKPFGVLIDWIKSESASR